MTVTNLVTAEIADCESVPGSLAKARCLSVRLVNKVSGNTY
jgi:hypothetical protein